MDLINKLIDSKNKWLWDLVKIKDKISVSIWNGSSAAVLKKSNGYEILLTDLCKDSFNHELCHIYLNQLIGPYFQMLISGCDKKIRRFINRGCFLHIGNCIEHYLFYDLYVSVGGDPTKFIQDYNIKKGNNFEYNLTKIDKYSIDSFLGNFFSVLADKNPKIDYYETYTISKRLNYNIYQACINLMMNAKRIGYIPKKYFFGIVNGEWVMIRRQKKACNRFWSIVKKEIFR
ncbi:MAG TPA: hypothetical protein DCG77_15045 [Sphingobacterium sp.]|nr:hypothetical protein [Sphingobacterium sp.]